MSLGKIRQDVAHTSDGNRTGRGPRDLEGPVCPVVPGLKKSKSPGTFFEGPGTPRSLFLDRNFANKVQI